MATYFIDFNAANDSANGTSTSTPWKRCPGMQGFSHLGYAHSAGDKFIFKGGVTWPLSCFPLNISFNGTSLSVRDYYGGVDTGGVEKTWYTGGAWTQPTFDFQDSNPGTAVPVGGNFVRVDNIRFYNYAIHPFTTNSSSGIVVATNGNASATTVTVQNCKFQDYANVFCCFATNTGIEVTGNEFTQQGRIVVGTDNVSRIPFAIAVNGVPYFTHNHVHHISSVMNYCSGIEYSYNHVHDSYKPYRADPNVTDSAHCNAFQIGRPCSVHDNLIHDLDGQMSPLSINPNFSGVNTGSSLTYNNHLYNVFQAWGVTADSGSNGYNSSNGIDVFFYNNTGASTGGININAALRVPSDKFKSLQVQNNLTIGNGLAIVNAVVAGGAIVTDHNISLSSSAHYTNGIPDSGAPSVNAGVTTPSGIFTTDILGVSRGATWDIGAYEFVPGGGDVTPPSVGLTAPANGATVSGTISITATASDNVGVASVEFLVDGVSKNTDTVAPYAYSFDTTTVSDGSRTIQAVARDAAGNSSSSTVSVTVQNAVATAVISVSPSTAYNFGSVAANGTPADTVYTVSNAALPGGPSLSGAASIASPFSIVSGGTYTALAPGASQAVTVRYRPTVKANDSAALTFTGGGGATRTLSGICYPVLVGLGPHDASSAVVTAPFTVSSTDVSQSSETLTVAASGRLSFGVNVAIPGDYTLRLSVKAEADGTNSLFVNVDGEPVSPTMISDITSLTTGFQLRTLSLRGTGAFDAPQFNPKTFTLTSGLHEVVIRGREANTVVRSIELVAVTPPPPPALTLTTSALPTSGETPLTVAFTSTVGGGTAPYSYAWAFGDAATSTSANPSHTYVGANTYNAVLTVTDAAAQTATASLPIPVTAPPPPPLALSISATPDHGTAPLAVAFTSTVSGGTTSYSYAWTFGDAGTSTSANPSHTYSAAGTYTASLTVTDSSSTPQTATRTATIMPSALPNQPPVCSLSADVPNGIGPLDVIFTITASDADGTVASGILNYGDGTSPVSITTPGASDTRSHTYGSVLSLTTYNATWVVTDNSGATATSTQNVTVSPTPPPPPNQPPICALSQDRTSAVGPIDVTFTLTSSDADGTVASGVLNYGDGVSATITAPSASETRLHTYAAVASPTTYTVTWTVTDNSAATAFATRSVTITPAPPAPLSVVATASTNRDVVPLGIDFTASPTGGVGAYTYAWDFGDSIGTSTSRTPGYTYDTPGDYVAVVTVTDSAAHTASASIQITALPLPLTVVLTAAPPNGVAPLAVALAAIPAGGVAPYTYAWTFGDTGTSTTARPSHTYAAGTFSAACTVTDSNSQTASSNLPIVVTAAPSSDETVPAILYVP